MIKFSHFRRRKPVILKDRSIVGKILGSAFIASTFSAGAYLIGFVFHTRYLSTLHLNAELYPKESGDYFYYAYIAFTDLMSGALLAEHMVSNMLSLAVVLFSVVILSFAANTLSESNWMKRQRDKVTASRRQRQVGIVVFMPILGTALIFYIPFLLLILLILPAIVGENTGSRRGLADREAFLQPCESPKAGRFCTELHSGDGKRIALGYMVDASEKYVAIVERGISRSIPVEDVYFRSAPAKR